MREQSTNQFRFSQGLKTSLISIFVNMILAVIKSFTGIIGRSYALLADGVESVMDIFSSTIVYSGFKISSIPPDHNHPFGHGRAESLAAMVVSLSLVSAGVIIAIQSVRELFIPHVGPHPATLIILLLVIITKELLFRFLFKAGQSYESTAMISDAWHSRSDALTSLAAFVGISITLIGGTKYNSADEWAALFASGIILYNGIRLFKVALGEIMDEAVDPTIETRVRQVAEQIRRVRAVEKCRVRKSGYGYFLELHIEVDGHMTVIESHDVAHQVKDALLKSEIKVIDATIHIEPSHGDYPH